MNPFEMVVAIVLIVMVASVLKARFKAQQGQPADDGEAARAREEMRQLKERIQVLERVLTDNHGGSELDRQIERLRDR